MEEKYTRRRTATLEYDSVSNFSYKEMIVRKVCDGVVIKQWTVDIELLQALRGEGMSYSSALIMELKREAMEGRTNETII